MAQSETTTHASHISHTRAALPTPLSRTILPSRSMDSRRRSNNSRRSSHLRWRTSSSRGYPSYPVSQPMSASPTTQYASHPSMPGRREPPTSSGREPWQQGQPGGQGMQHQPQPSWAQPKPGPSVPVQSAWGAQHGGTPKRQVSTLIAPQQQQPPPQHSWPSTQPPSIPPTATSAVLARGSPRSNVWRP